MVLGPCLGVRPGETVTVEAWDHALPWARALVLETRRRRSTPTLVVEDEETFFRSLAQSTSRTVPGAPASVAGASDAYVYLPGPANFARLLGLSSEEQDAVLGRHGVEWRRNARRAGLRAVRVGVGAATSTAAARFGVDRELWERELVRGSLVAPDRLARAAHHLVRRLRRARRVRILHPNGTDLAVELLRRPPIVDDGRVDPADRRAGRLWTDLPSGAVEVSLRSGVGEGVWESNRATYHRFSDPPVRLGARFTFHRGRLSEYAFDRGGAAFAREYARGGRGRDQPARLVFGVNPAISYAPEVAEVAAGAVSLRIGGHRTASGALPSRFTYVSALSGATVELDGRPFLRDGSPVSPTRPARGVG